MSMLRTKTCAQGLWVAAALLTLPVAARANCERDMQDITPKVAQIKNADTRQKAEDYLQRAHRELDENDDFECQSAVDAAAKLVAQQPPAGR